MHIYAQEPFRQGKHTSPAPERNRNLDVTDLSAASAYYEYTGLMAQSWDLLRGDTSQWADRSFYREMLRRHGQPVLDVGCGTGRLLLDYLEQGVDVEGVDNSPEMLALCRQKAQHLGLTPRVYEQPMETLALPRAYRTILIPSSSLQLILDPQKVEQALQHLYAHLEPGGVLVASVMTLWKPGDPLQSEWETAAQRPEDGATIRRAGRSRYDPASECEHTEDVYQVLVGGKVLAAERHHRSPATRSYTQAQARALFERAGFREVELYHEFTLAPARPEDTLFVVVGRRA
jgi:ubiquinone/menaquinone biosynthesis C-methylase UbiE